MPQYKLPKKGGQTMDIHVREKAQIDYFFIHKKWKNSAINCEAYSSFEGMCVIRSPNSHGKNTTKPTKNATRTATTKH